MSIKNMDWVDGSSVVAWESDDGSCVRKQYTLPIGSACILIDRSGVAVVEPHEEVGKNNAVIFNENGRERVRLELPVPEWEAYCFYYMHYEDDKLMAVIATTSGDVAVTVDPFSGKCFDLHETR